MAAQQMADPCSSKPTVAEASDTLLVGGNDLIPHTLSHVAVARHKLVGGLDHLLQRLGSFGGKILVQNRTLLNGNGVSRVQCLGILAELHIIHTLVHPLLDGVFHAQHLQGGLGRILGSASGGSVDLGGVHLDHARHQRLRLLPTLLGEGIIGVIGISVTNDV